MNKFRSLQDKILLRISLKDSSVFLRKDFNDLGGYDQVGRCLKILVRAKKIIKLGYGLYARLQVSTLNGEVIPEKNLLQLAREALARLNVETAGSTLQGNYNAGKTTQVPTGRLIAVNGRISRKIGFGKTYVSYERIADVNFSSKAQKNSGKK